MGPSLDHDRHEPRGPGAGAHAPHGRKISLFPTWRTRPKGIKKEAELTGQKPPPHETENDIRKGFVYKRVPHVTLKSIANNPDIKEGHDASPDRPGHRPACRD